MTQQTAPLHKNSVDLTENWAPYELGPLLNREEAPDLSITAIGGTVDIDKIVLEEVDEFYYLIKSSNCH